MVLARTADSGLWTYTTPRHPHCTSRLTSRPISDTIVNGPPSGSVTNRPASGSVAELGGSSKTHVAGFGNMAKRSVTKIASFVQNNFVVLSLLGVHAAMWIGMVSKQLPNVAR